jgi:hypothetical protein
MPEITLESLAARLAAVERELAALKGGFTPAVRDWESVVGTFEDTESFRQMQAEMKAFKDAQRRAAENGDEE